MYVGAISILAIFTVLLTRGSEIEPGAPVLSRSWVTGTAIAIGTLAAVVLPILSSHSTVRAAADKASIPVKSIGNELMTTYLLPLEVMGLLLTAALIGAVVIAMSDTPAQSRKRTTAPRQIKQEPVATP